MSWLAECTTVPAPRSPNSSTSASSACDVLRARGGRALDGDAEAVSAGADGATRKNTVPREASMSGDVIDHWYPKLVHDATDEKIVLRGWRCECLLSVLKLRGCSTGSAQPGRYRAAPALVPLFSLDDGLVRHVLEFWVGGPAEPHPVCMLELLLDQHVSAAGKCGGRRVRFDELEADDEGKPVLLCASSSQALAPPTSAQASTSTSSPAPGRT